MILHVFNFSVVSGPETLVLPQLKELAQRVEVVFLIERRNESACRSVAAYARALGISTHEVLVRSRFDRIAIRSLANLFVQLCPDIVHAHDFKASTYAWRASRLCSQSKFALFSTHHGVRGRPDIRAKIYESAYTRIVLPNFDRVLTVCSSDRESLLARGLHADKVVVHRNGVNKPAVPPAERDVIQREIRSSWCRDGIPIGDVTHLIGYVGRLSPEKRPERILEVAQQLLRKHAELPPWKIVLFGSGPLLDSLEEKIRKLKLKDHVILAGYRESVGEELAGFDLIVSLSDAEGTPITLVEAGWARTPVVATGVDGVRDLITNGEHGVLVSPSDSDEVVAAAVANLLDDKEARISVANSFSERVRSSFSGSAWVRDLKVLYSDLAPSSFTKDSSGDNITAFHC